MKSNVDCLSNPVRGSSSNVFVRKRGQHKLLARTVTTSRDVHAHGPWLREGDVHGP